jgi:hypothetical protein
MKTFGEFSEESIQIEVLGKDDQWRRVDGGILNRPQSISQALRATKKRYPKDRCRAVGQQTGKLYDTVP